MHPKEHVDGIWFSASHLLLSGEDDINHQCTAHYPANCEQDGYHKA